MLAHITPYSYADLAAANSVAGIDSPITSRRTSAPSTGAIFSSVSYGGCAWETSGSAGFLECRSVNLRTVAHPSIDSEMGGSSTLGVSTMAKLCLFPSVRSLKDRAAAHRAMARAALFADSSTRTRLKRYNHHMSKARAFDAAAIGKGGAA